jgi:hypothetical protein
MRTDFLVDIATVVCLGILIFGLVFSVFIASCAGAVSGIKEEQTGEFGTTGGLDRVGIGCPGIHCIPSVRLQNRK